MDDDEQGQNNVKVAICEQEKDEKFRAS